MKVVIVGGVAGGASAATRLRRLSEDAEIVLFEKGEYISYANCGLPYYLGRVITDRERLIVTKTQLLRDRFNVDVRVQSEVTAINRDRKTVTVRSLADNRTYEEPYDKLLLSPGASPKILPIPGIDSRGVFTLRTLSDTYRIDDFVRETRPSRAVIVGGGFIGVEMAENLKERGMDVTLVEFMDQVLTFLDREMAIPIHQNLRENGIHLQLSAGVSGIIPVSGPDKPAGGHNLSLTLTTGVSLQADLVIMCTGVTPDSSLAAQAGLKTGVGGGIVVDDSFRTSDPDILAVGDAICVQSLISGKEVLVPLAGPANKQGREAAEVILRGSTSKWPQRTARIVQGTSVVKIFDQTAASTGFSERQLKKEGISYLKTYIHPSSHASYYPNATNMSMKLLFSPEGKILGAQAIGFEGVDKRIDVVAAALRLGGNIYDLEELELSYAPPYSSAKDPVNMLGFTAANILKGDMKPVYAEDVDGLIANGAFFIDVSTPDEIVMGTIPGAVSIPLDELRGRLSEIPSGAPVYVFCRVGLRGYVASRILAQHGYEVYNLSGGYRTYNLLRQEEKALKKDAQTAGKAGSAEVPATPRQAVQPASYSGVSAAAAPEKSAAVRLEPSKTITVDACGLQCPGPIMKVAAGVKELTDGDVLRVTATDPAFATDVNVWCERTGNTLLSVQREKGIYTVDIRKGTASPGISGQEAAPASAPVSAGNDKSMVVFSGDFDKALAAFIIANGAAAMGRKVTIFFTFWGLNILRKDTYVPVRKTFIEKMFGAMMPRGTGKLGLSRMNMGGIGTKMIKGIMKKKNVQTLEELMKAAMDSGVRLLACQMSMDLMGIKEEELIEGVELAGVATFIGSAETSDTNLFI